MKISIVVPVYNCESYINESIESVINQTNDNWELILVNDGSTDKSGDICTSYSQKYPEKIFSFNKENEGQFLTRKYGILKCTGDYVGFLDADDLLDKDYVKILTDSISEYHSPDVLCFGFVRFGDNMNKEITVTDRTICFRTSNERKYVYNQIISGQLTGSLCSKAFKKSIISDNLPDEQIVKNKRFAEDAYHSFDALANSESILYLSHSLYGYRDNEQSFSHGFEQRNLDYFNSKYLFELLENNLGIMGLGNAEFKEKLCTHNFNDTVHFMLKYFRAAKTLKRKKEIIDFDWSSYLLEDTIKLINRENNYRKSYVKVWKAFSKKKYLTILFREKFKRIIGW
ncbi:MAG: glycosyltransferase family 2 protein [Clostridia bacterium]|nr:glycosyltransferase family 2 protein [Clostridia bacterium]